VFFLLIWFGCVFFSFDRKNTQPNQIKRKKHTTKPNQKEKTHNQTKSKEKTHLYLQFGWCYVFVPSVWVVLCLCTFSLGGAMALYLQHGGWYVLTTQTEGTKT
jgi:hypothetical protein